jgi:hypothetical protein
MSDPVDHLTVIEGGLAAPVEPPIGDFDDDKGGGGGRPIRMKDGCPVEPLGTEGNLFYFLTALGELRALPADKVANKNIVGMFAPHTQYLFDTWPRKKWVKNEELAEGGEWIVTGWRADDVSIELMKVAAARGVWNAHEKVRGRGAWRDDEGGLLLHCGDQLLRNGIWTRPGQYDGFVYPTAPPVPRPSGKRADAAPAEELLAMLKTWQWARGHIDPILLLGWIVAGMVGGALDHRPVIWVTGDKSTGKTALQRLIVGVCGGGLLQSSDATEAAVRQLLGQQSLPVAIDEAEADEDNRRMMALVKLARQAATGGRIVRGGQDHTAHEFIARSCFSFSSILVPPLPAQDRSRIAVLELGPLPKGSSEPRTSPLVLRQIGAALRRRFADAWGVWPDVLAAFRRALIDDGGHTGRGADVFATLLAAAHVALVDEAPDERELVDWGELLKVETLAELADDVSEAERCLQYLGSSLVQLAGHGTPRLVSDWVQQACTDSADPEARAEATRAKEMLAKIGLGIAGQDRNSSPRDRGAAAIPGRLYLVVANAHQGLAQQFEGSHWKGKSGASGVWSQALARIPGAVRNQQRRISGVQTRCTLIPVEAVTGDGVPAEENCEAPEYV